MRIGEQYMNTTTKIIKYHNNCYNCGKVFWTEDAWGDICLECEDAYREYSKDIIKDMKEWEYVDAETAKYIE